MKKARGEGGISGGGTGFSHTVTAEKGSIRITAELPGVGEERIRIDLDGKVLTISVNGGGRPYRESIALPCEARLGRKRFSGGVLELFLERAA